MKIERIYLDMDGVLAKFVEAICKLHGLPDPYLTNPEALGSWETEKFLGLTPEQFWQPTDTNFWKNIEKYETASDLVHACAKIVGMDNLYILTSPIRKDRGQQMQNACVEGKTRWIFNYFPLLQSRILFARNKSKEAMPGYLLIDDKPSNVEGFCKAGGEAILVPRPWNSDHMLASVSHGIVIDRLLFLAEN